MEENEIKKERFSFALTVNGNIVCKRYFKIFGPFKERSLNSYQMRECVDACVDLIDRNLKAKSRVFNWYSAPQVFQNEEEMNSWLGKHELSVPTTIVLRESDKSYIWNGREAEPYTRLFNKFEYVRNDKDENECFLKFIIYDREREVISQGLDGKYAYPRFVRNNLDLSNSKNKYEDENAFIPVEAALINLMNADHGDLVPEIVNTIMAFTTYDSDSSYENKVKYGNKEYNLNIREYNNSLIKLFDKRK